MPTKGSPSTPAANRRKANPPDPATPLTLPASGSAPVPEDRELATLAVVNSELWHGVAQQLDIIKAHPAFADIDSADALPITAKMDEESGFQEPYHKTKFDVAMARKGRYRCAQNMFKHQLLMSVTPGVPIREYAVQSYMNFYFQTPAPLEQNIVVAIPNGKDPMKDPDSCIRFRAAP